MYRGTMIQLVADLSESRVARREQNIFEMLEDKNCQPEFYNH